MDLTLSSNLWVPRVAPRGKLAFYDMRQHRPISAMYAQLTIPPLDAVMIKPRELWLGEAREEGEWVDGVFRLSPHLVEAGLVVQPLPWIPGLAFQLVNLASWGIQLWAGAKFGELLKREAVGTCVD